MATESRSLLALALIAGPGGPEIDGVIVRIDAAIQAAKRMFVELESAG